MGPGKGRIPHERICAAVPQRAPGRRTGDHPPGPELLAGPWVPGTVSPLMARGQEELPPDIPVEPLETALAGAALAVTLGGDGTIYRLRGFWRLMGCLCWG